MAITSCSEFCYPFYLDPQSTGSSLALTSTNITQSTIPYLAMIVRVPKSGTLDRFEWRTANVTNDPDNGVRCSFQDIDATTGVPDGGVDQYRIIPSGIASNTWQNPGSITDDGTAGGVKRSVTKDDIIACVLDLAGGVSGDTVGISILSTTTNTNKGLHTYYATANTTPTWTKQNVGLCMALVYDDGSIATFQDGIVWPASSISTVTFNSGSTPDEYAIRFQIPFQLRASGLWLRGDFDNDADIILYDAGDSVIGSFSIDKDLQRAAVSGMHIRRFSSDVTISANTTYRIAVKPGASSINIHTITVPSNDYLAAVGGGVEWYLSTRTNDGSWTDNDAAWMPGGLFVNGIEVGAGSSGGGSFTFVG